MFIILIGSLYKAFHLISWKMMIMMIQFVRQLELMRTNVAILTIIIFTQEYSKS